MTEGGIIIMPIAIVKVATTISITRNGSAIMKPISKPRRNSEIMKAGARTRRSAGSPTFCHMLSFDNDSNSRKSFSRTCALMKARNGAVDLV